ncbi:hypothetical protein OsccyDRAFT_1429 [Leptolyngbyaceae cyanobacterium JSC-12]|nr:hypothetical protein OsccyDRAFT_1429 [Leptolyngbyaceae cyanobacterium JSC-12]
MKDNKRVWATVEIVGSISGGDYWNDWRGHLHLDDGDRAILLQSGKQPHRLQSPLIQKQAELKCYTEKFPQRSKA